MEILAEFIIPFKFVDVKEHRSRGVGIVGRMGHSARQAVKDPGVDRAEKDLPLTCPGLKSRHFFEDPLDLRRRKIRIRDKARLISYFFDEFRIGGLQFFNKGRRSSALPDDRVINGASRVLFPKDRRFSLVRDTDAGDLAGLDIGLGQSLTDTVAHRSPEVFRIVFDPARLRVVLVKGLLRRGHASAILPEDHGTRRCGSLVDRKHVLTHRRLLRAIVTLAVMCARTRFTAWGKSASGRVLSPKAQFFRISYRPSSVWQATWYPSG